MTNIKITVQADNLEGLSQSIEAQDHDIEGLKLKIVDRPRSLGMATGNELLVMAAVFAGNVSAGLVANYIFMKLTQPHDGKPADSAHDNGIAIFIGDEIASSEHELEIIIRKKQKEKNPEG